MSFEEKPKDTGAHEGGISLGVVTFFGISEIANTFERKGLGLRIGRCTGSGVDAVNFHLHADHVVLLA